MDGSMVMGPWSVHVHSLSIHHICCIWTFQLLKATGNHSLLGGLPLLGWLGAVDTVNYSEVFRLSEALRAAVQGWTPVFRVVHRLYNAQSIILPEFNHHLRLLFYLLPKAHGSFLENHSVISSQPMLDPTVSTALYLSVLGRLLR